MGFEVKDTSKKFDKVTRLQCRLTEEGYDMHLDLDVNTDLWPLELGERFTFALASTLSLDGAPDTGAYDQSNQSSLLDQYEYALRQDIQVEAGEAQGGCRGLR